MSKSKGNRDGVLVIDEFKIDPEEVMKLLEKHSEELGVSVTELLQQPPPLDLMPNDNSFKAGYHSAINDVIAEMCEDCKKSPCYNEECRQLNRLKEMRGAV